MSVSAVLLFLRREVIDQAFPLELKVPNTQTRAGDDALEEALLFYVGLRGLRTDW